MYAKLRSKNLAFWISSATLLASLPTLANAEVHCLVPRDSTGIEDQVQIALAAGQSLTEKSEARLSDSQVRGLLRKALRTQAPQAAREARAQLEAEAQRSITVLGDLLLVHPDDEVRRVIVDILAGVGPKAAPYLIQFGFNFPSTEFANARQDAARALVRLDDRMVDRIRASLSKHLEPRVRAFFILALGEGGDQGLSVLSELLDQSSKAEDRHLLIEAMGKTGRSAIPRLLTELKRDPGIVTRALEQAGALNPSQLDTFLSTGTVRLESGAQLELRNLQEIDRIRLLGKLGPKALPELMRLAKESRQSASKNVHHIIAAIFNTGSPDAEAKILELIPRGRIGGGDVLVALNPSNGLVNEFPRFKTAALVIELARTSGLKNGMNHLPLKKIFEGFQPQAQLLEGMRKAIRPTSGRFRSDNLVIALGFLGEPALPLLTDLLKSEHFANIREDILIGLGYVGPKAIPVLAEYFASASGRFRRADLQLLSFALPTTLDEHADEFVDQVLKPMIRNHPNMGPSVNAAFAQRLGSPALRLFKEVGDDLELKSQMDPDHFREYFAALARTAGVDSRRVSQLTQVEIGRGDGARFETILSLVGGVAMLPSNRNDAAVQEIIESKERNGEAVDVGTSISALASLADQARIIPEEFQGLDEVNFPSVRLGKSLNFARRVIFGKTRISAINTQLTAIRVVSGSGAEGAELLGEILKNHRISGFRQDAAKELGTLGEVSLPTLVSVLETEKESRVRFTIIESIAKINSDRALRVLHRAMMTDAEIQVRGRSSDLLIDEFGSRALPALKQGLLENSDSRVRASIARNLHKIGKSAFELLTESVQKDKEPEVVREALTSVERLVNQDPQLAETLLPHLKHPDPFMRANFAVTIAASGLPLVVEPLRELLSDSDEGVRVAVLNAFAKLPKALRSSALPKIRELLNDDSGLVRFQAQRVLQESTR